MKQIGIFELFHFNICSKLPDFVEAPSLVAVFCVGALFALILTNHLTSAAHPTHKFLQFQKKIIGF